MRPPAGDLPLYLQRSPADEPADDPAEERHKLWRSTAFDRYMDFR
jgi:hypothetical protein